MIRINLAQKKQASGTKAGGTNVGTLTSIGRMRGASLSPDLLPLIGKILLPLILSVAAFYGYDYYTQQLTDDMQKEMDVVTKERDRIQDELKRIKGFEAVKADLEQNDLILRTKIDTIEKLITGRDFTVKSLVTLSQALPHEVWLTQLDATESSFEFKGGTVDIGVISDLMTHLGQTIYFKDVTLKSTEVDSSGKQATFELTARRE
jgi:Tfp pilus assembly protein PilN